MPRFLPREGLTLEAIFGLISHSALEPLVTGPLLLGILYYPEQVISVLPPNARGFIESAAFVSTLKVLLGCGAVRRINNFLSRVVLNNFTSDIWNAGKEIVVVTGASNGIGAAIAREISKTSACVIALDLYPPKQPFRK
jgi:all-trans-retinol dehydrogenase (NAD+)